MIRHIIRKWRERRHGRRMYHAEQRAFRRGWHTPRYDE